MSGWDAGLLWSPASTSMSAFGLLEELWGGGGADAGARANTKTSWSWPESWTDGGGFGTHDASGRAHGVHCGRAPTSIVDALADFGRGRGGHHAHAPTAFPSNSPGPDIFGRQASLLSPNLNSTGAELKSPETLPPRDARAPLANLQPVSLPPIKPPTTGKGGRGVPALLGLFLPLAIPEVRLKFKMPSVPKIHWPFCLQPQNMFSSKCLPKIHWPFCMNPKNMFSSRCWIKPPSVSIHPCVYQPWKCMPDIWVPLPLPWIHLELPLKITDNVAMWYLTWLFLKQLRNLSRVLRRGFSYYGDGELQIMTDHLSNSIIRTDINNSRKFSCWKSLRSLPVRDGSGLDKNLMVHPSITFAKPQTEVHVRLEDPYSGELLWDADYNLRGTQTLTPHALPTGGQKLEFSSICPNHLDSTDGNGNSPGGVHQYFLHVSRNGLYTDRVAAEHPGNFIGSGIFTAYTSGNDPRLLGNSAGSTAAEDAGAGKATFVHPM